MIKVKMQKLLITGLLLPLLLAASDAYAQKKVISGIDSAGFVIAAQGTSSDSKADEPVIYYQQNIQMLADIKDRISMSIFSDGRVFVHYPVYMKKAGDYEMQLDEPELLTLIQSLSGNGVLDFDEKKVKEKVQAVKNARRAKGELFVISDAVETVVDIRLDEYQKNKTSKIIKKFHKQFRWKNIEQDAVHYKNIAEIASAYRSVKHLQTMMQDKRLVKDNGGNK